MKSLRVPKPGPAGWSRSKPEGARRPGFAVPEKSAPSAPESGDPVDRAARFGHSLERLPVIQRMLTDADEPQPGFFSKLKKMFSRGSDGDRQPLTREQMNPGPFNYDAVSARQTPTSSDVQTGGSVLGGAASAAGEAAGIVGLLGASGAPNIEDHIGGGASIVGAATSLLDTYHAGKQFVGGGDRPVDRAVTGSRAVSSLSKAMVQSSSAARQFATAASNSGAASLATKVAAPAAMVMGGVDLVGGSVSAGLAAHREKNLQALQQTAEPEGRGLARFAEGSQKTKKVRGIGRALGGGLALGGGIALALGAGPIGWGLLGGAAAIGGGMTLYQKWRKHQEGKALAEEPGYREDLQAANVHMPTQEDLARDKWYRKLNPLNTKASRTHDMVRGQVAATLQNSYHQAFEREDILENLGLKSGDGTTRPGATAQDIARELEG